MKRSNSTVERTKESELEAERLQKQKGRAATVTRTMNTKPTRDRSKPESFQSAEKSEPAPKKAKASPPPPKRSRPKPRLNIKKIAAALRAYVTGKGDEYKILVEEANAKRSAVVEVEKILAVKANVKGGLVYHILWADGTKSWEPEDNVMDDDLVDEFEAAEQKKAYSEDDIKVGSEVEVKNVDEGFENSWSAAVVTKEEAGNKFAVEFDGFVNDDGQAESEVVERDRLRLVPEKADKSWVPVVGEIIEMNEDDCWWEARVMEVDGKKATLQLRVSDELKTSTTGPKKLRPCSWLTMANKRAK